jgi:hypothetical protein
VCVSSLVGEHSLNPFKHADDHRLVVLSTQGVPFLDNSLLDTVVGGWVRSAGEPTKDYGVRVIVRKGP